MKRKKSAMPSLQPGDEITRNSKTSSSNAGFQLSGVVGTSLPSGLFLRRGYGDPISLSKILCAAFLPSREIPTIPTAPRGNLRKPNAGISTVSTSSNQT